LAGFIKIRRVGEIELGGRFYHQRSKVMLEESIDFHDNTYILTSTVPGLGLRFKQSRGRKIALWK
jgi:hypothetical protein